MMKKSNWLLLIFATALLSCQNNEKIFDDIEIGQTKHEIKKNFGEPHSQNITTKNQIHIWGPQEEFWAQIPKGTKIETWQYSQKQGQILLYFTDESNVLAYKVFIPEGVTYESTK